MENYKFISDINYKINKGLETKQTVYKTQLKIKLWKINNRLSYLRLLYFMEKFFLGFAVKITTIKTRTKKTKKYLEIVFPWKSNYNLWTLIDKKFPEPDITRVAGNYKVIFNFYRFKIQLLVSQTDYETLFRIQQAYSKKWQDT